MPNLGIVPMKATDFISYVRGILILTSSVYTQHAIKARAEIIYMQYLGRGNLLDVHLVSIAQKLPDQYKVIHWVQGSRPIS